MELFELKLEEKDKISENDNKMKRFSFPSFRNRKLFSFSDFLRKIGEMKWKKTGIKISGERRRRHKTK